MKLRAFLTNRGITIEAGEPAPPLEADPAAHQKAPRGHYVYAHIDNAGRVFYVGKGTDRRAWSTERHPLWQRYVDTRSGGLYSIRILKDGLDPDQAEELESEWMDQHGPTLVNWVNAARQFDHAALDRYGKLRANNIRRLERARALEKSDLCAATVLYLEAIEALAEFAGAIYETGLVAELQREAQEEQGICGDIEALDRLSMCLVKLGRAAEARAHADQYFARYRADSGRPAASRIRNRIEKALLKAGTHAPERR